MESKKVNYWQNLKSEFMEFLSNEIPDKSTRKGYSRSIDLLVEFATANDEPKYSPELGYKFFESETSKSYKGETTLGRRRATIRHLNQYLYGKTFWQRAPRDSIDADGYPGHEPGDQPLGAGTCSTFLHSISRPMRCLSGAGCIICFWRVQTPPARLRIEPRRSSKS